MGKWLEGMGDDSSCEDGRTTIIIITTTITTITITALTRAHSTSKMDESLLLDSE